MLTNQTRAALVDVLRSLDYDKVSLLMLKHLDIRDSGNAVDDLLRVLESANTSAVCDLLVELIDNKTDVRVDAPIKRTFDGRIEELKRRLRTDGFEVTDGTMTQLQPAAQPAAQITDYLERVLDTELDQSGEIRRLLRESHNHMSASPPDYNSSTTKVRIALETIARRSAHLIATKRFKTLPDDKWGAAIAFLRTENVIGGTEAEALVRVYSLISPGAHVPKGLTDEQWALLSRTFALSSAYFLTQQHLAT